MVNAEKQMEKRKWRKIKMILAAVGKNASGKDYFLEFISREYGIPLLSMGDVARDLAEKEGLEKTRENLHYISEKYMGIYGQDFFPNQLIEKIKALNAESVLVSGVRPPSDVEKFKTAFGKNFYLAAIIVSDDHVRYERTRSRGSARDDVTFEKFLELDEHEEALFHTSQSIGMADFVLYNDAPGEAFHNEIREFYRKNFVD